MAVFGPVVCLVTLIALSSTAAAATDNPDVDTSAAYLYTVDTDGGLVNVTITVNVTADKPDRTTSTTVTQYFFEGYGIAIPAGVDNLTITDDAGRDLAFEVIEEDERTQALAINFRRNLFYRQSTTIVVSYDMVEDRDNEYSLVRVNPAYIGLEIWTDPFLEAATVELTTPMGFVSSNPYLIGEDEGQLRFEVEEGLQRFTANDVDPENFWQVLSLNRPEMLDVTPINVSGHQVTLQSWPGDEDWVDDAVESISESLPALIDTIGLDWPLDDELTITQSFDPELAGYAGWYDTETHEILVGDNFDDHVMIHEMSHMWFNRELSTDRWITEGLANTYAAETLAAIGEERPTPESVRRTAPDALPLADWRQFETDLEVEDWAYPASWMVMDDILELVGKETLDVAVAAMFNDEIPYVGDGKAEAHSGYSNWRYFLDLLENRSGGDIEELQELYFDWVLDYTDDPYLERRPEPRQSYHDLIKRGDDWAAPRVVRTQMSNWTFEAAEKRIETANGFLDRRDQLLELIEPVGADLPPILEESYEKAGDTDMTETQATFDETERAADILVASHRKVSDATGFFQQIGAIGTDFDLVLADSNEAFAAGDFDRVEANNDDLSESVADLQEQGLLRSGAAVGGLLIVALSLFGLIRRRRQGGQVDAEQWPDPTGKSTPAIDLNDSAGEP